MSPLGNVAYKADVEGNTMISGEMASKIDKEVAHLIDQAYQTALGLLREKQEKLMIIAEHLIEVETIDGEELDRMLFAA